MQIYARRFFSRIAFSVLAGLLLPSGATFAAEGTVRPDTKAELNGEPSDRGWFFFREKQKPEVKEEDPAPAAEQAPQAKPEAKPVSDQCKSTKTWKPSCGFIDPGNDFAFQERMRDELLQHMSLSNNDPKAVEAVQYYVKWVMSKSVQVARLWQYNMTQNPELDPFVQQPISSFGLKLMTEVKSNEAQDIFNALRDQGAFLVYFTRSDCAFCHSMAPVVAKLSADSGVPVRNAALDSTCIAEFQAGCLTQPETIPPAQALQVSVVPALFLYVPENTWLRIGTGVVDGATLTARMTSFFSAYRAALLKGIKNGDDGRASVDFTNTDPTGLGQGVTSEEGAPKPSPEDIKRLFDQSR